MAEAILLPIAKSILEKLVSFTDGVVIGHVTKEISAAKSATKDLIIIAQKMKAICAVLEDAEQKQFTNKAMDLWLTDLKSVVYDIDDLLDEVAFDDLQCQDNKGHFGHQLRYYLSSTNPIISRFQLSHKLKDLREKLENIVMKKNDFGLTDRPVEMSRDEIRNPLDGCSYVKKTAILGRDEAKQDILNRLVAVSDVSEVSVLPVVGMGGIGKTSLAKLVHQDVQHFDLKLWVCVSDKFHIPKIIEDILKDGSGDNTPNQNLKDGSVDNTPNQNLNTLVKKLHAMLNGKKYFLVLDDVWVEDVNKWQEFKDLFLNAKAGSVILITTRIKKVASITQTAEAYDLDSLPHSVCWSMFEQLVFKESEEGKYQNLRDIGKSITAKCRGIPLVVKSLTSLLRNVRDDQEWQRINDMDSFIGINNQEYDKVMQVLKLNYDKLPSHLKSCFVYLSLYVKNSFLTIYEVPYMWSALGLLKIENTVNDIDGGGYIDLMELVSKSLLQEPIRIIDGLFVECKMHDLLHDLALKILDRELVYTEELGNKPIVSEFARLIVYNSTSIEDEEFPKGLLKSKKARTFQIGYTLNKHISQSLLEKIISNFTCLRILDLSTLWFEELPKSIGSLKHLRYLDLSKNPIMKSVPSTIGKLLNLETLLIDGCEQLKEVPMDVYKLRRLKKLRVTTCQVNLISSKLVELSSLQVLSFESCKRLISLWDNHNVVHLTSLRSLYIDDCPKLTSLPNSMKYLVTLKVLSIGNCDELELDDKEGFQGLASLRLIVLDKIMNLARLPQGIKSAASTLQYLRIYNCKCLVELPDWLYLFTSLKEIWLEGCPQLLCLPVTFRQITSLQKLFIFNCPHLSKRCAFQTGEDYSLIQHVAEFELDGVTFPPNNESHKNKI